MIPKAFELSRVPGTHVSDGELIEDLRRVATMLSATTVPSEQYSKFGNYAAVTQKNRFGSWNAALRRAGLKINNRINIPEEELFENMLAVWQHYGRQPRRSEMANAPSSASHHPYVRRYGSWMKALKVFVDYANGAGAVFSEHEAKVPAGDRRKTPRDPSLRLRWIVLQRDHFKCCVCGASPAITLGVELHVDHVYPWEKGGETVLENLQTLCSKCNLGKSNLVPIRNGEWGLR